MKRIKVFIVLLANGFYQYHDTFYWAQQRMSGRQRCYNVGKLRILNFE
jgi:hypothetical protein